MLIKDNLTRQKIVFCIFLLLIAFFISSCGPEPVPVPDIVPGQCEEDHVNSLTPLEAKPDEACTFQDDDYICTTHNEACDSDNDGNFDEVCCSYKSCTPKTCTQKFPGADSCVGSEVCVGEWKDPPNGDDNCCSEECVLPCGYEIATGPRTTPCINYSIVYDNIQEIESSGDSVCEKQEEFAQIYPQGVATCMDGCIDFAYAVEGPATVSKWCEKCAGGTSCCVYCPPKTVYKEGVGCVSCDCTYTCQKAAGLPYNEGGDNEAYLDTGFSICQPNCGDLGDDVVWKGYSASSGNQWCVDIQGGTEFETYSQCCGYCPPDTYYNSATKTCDPESDLSDTFEAVLDCPYIMLTWGESDEIEEYFITIFYDDDKPGEILGKCIKDIITTTERHYELDLGLLNCAEHMIGNVKIEVFPQYYDERDVKEPYVSKWIDVSECNIVPPKPEDCTDGVDNDNDNDVDCEDLDCVGKHVIVKEEYVETGNVRKHQNHQSVKMV